MTARDDLDTIEKQNYATMRVKERLIMRFGDKLKDLRKKRKLTQDELADVIFVSRQTISNWENNKSYPSMDYIVTLSQLFDVTVDTLIQDKIEVSDDNVKKVTSLSEQATIEKNKFRIILSRLTFTRFIFVWAGSFLTVYFFMADRYVNYIAFPIILFIIGLLTSIPIYKIKKKYHLVTQKDLTEFFDERYK